MEIVLLLYLGFLFAVLIHEAGHALAVLWVGHSLREFSVGPVGIFVEPRGCKVRLRAELFSGQVRYDRHHSKTSLFTEFLIVCGGVTANLLGALIALVIYQYFSDNALYFFICIIFLFAAISNVVPVQIKKTGLKSDGKQFMELIAFTTSIKKYRSTNSINIEVAKKYPFTLSENKPNANAIEIALFNDDITPMLFVVDVLISNFEIDDFSAAVIMFEIHENGTAKVGWFEHSIARACVERINQQAKSNGYPFFCRTA